MTAKGLVRSAALFAFALGGLAAPAAGQMTLTFEDIPTTTTAPIPSSYHGMQWVNFNVIHEDYVVPSGYKNGTVSPTHVAFNGGGNAAEFSSSTAKFNFTRAYFTAVWRNGLTLEMRGYRNGSQVFFQALTLNASGPLLATVNFLNVDRVTFNSFGGTPVSGYRASGTHFAMDDATFNAVPEPASMMLVGTGLFGLLGYGRRRKPRVESA